MNQARQHCGEVGLHCSGNPGALYSTCERAARGGWGISTPPPLGGWWPWIPCTELILGRPVAFWDQREAQSLKPGSGSWDVGGNAEERGLGAP